MSVGMCIAGKVRRTPAKPSRAGAAVMARRVGEWFESEFGQLMPFAATSGSDEGREFLHVPLYAGTEELFLTFDDEGEVTAEANTGWGGPGYHKQVCEVLDAMGKKFSIEWTLDSDADETGYFHRRNWKELNEAVGDWIVALCNMVAEEMKKTDEPIDFSVGMPLNFGVGSRGTVQTPLGPRSPGWFGRAARDPAMAAELLGWADPTVGARAWRSRALAAMWLHVRWSAPRTEAEARLNGYVLNAMQASYDLDPNLEQPWRAWRELAELNETPIPADAVARAERSSETTPVGYLRGLVTRAPFPGWSITVPGSMTEDVDDETPIWFDDLRAVRFSVMTIGGEVSALSPSRMMKRLSSPEGEPLGEWKGEGVLGKMAVAECKGDDGETGTNFQAVVAGVGQFAVCTVTTPDRSHAAFAKEVCRSVRFSAEGGSRGGGS